MYSPTYAWAPMVLPVFKPVPMRRPRVLDLDEPLLIDLPAARFLSLGLGRVDMDIKWSWHWSSNGTLHVFRSWTGLEMLRFTVRPLGMLPDAAWQSVRVEYDSSRMDIRADQRRVRDVLRALLGLSSALADVPSDLPQAVGQARMPEPAPPYPPATLVEALKRRLPCPAARLTMGEHSVPLPADLLLTSAEVDGAAALLSFSDGSRLWIYASRPSVDPIGLETIAGGALLWPASGWPLPHEVASWSMLTDGERRTQHHLRDDQGEALDAESFPPAGETGLANLVLDLPLAP